MSPAGFPLPDLGWTAEGIAAEHLPEVQALFEACPDYFDLVEGRPTPADAAITEWEALPPGRTREHKHFWGLRDGTGRMRGCLECSEDYPESGIVWLGLLLLHPGARGSGRGRAVEAAFAAWVQARGRHEIQLAVVDTNTAALAFWASLGYVRHRTAEHRVIGLRTHRLQVLRRPLR